MNLSKRSDRARTFTLDFADHHGIRRRLAAFAHRDGSAELGRHLTRLIDCRVAGEVPPPNVSRYLDGLPARIVGNLARWGILDPQRLAAAMPLVEHIDAFEADLLAAGKTERHAALVSSRARKLAAGCGFVVLADLSAEVVTAFLARLRDGTAKLPTDGNQRPPKPGGLSAQTSNFYLAALKQVLRWMKANGRAGESPAVAAVLNLRQQNVATDRRHDRRALSDDELRRLIDAAAVGPVVQGMSGPDRALLYRVAAETGLRAGELRTLRRRDLVLDAEQPTVTVAAEHSKNGKPATLPLRQTTAAVLAEVVGAMMPAATVFNVPPRQHVAKMVRADLLAARSAWLTEAEGDPAEQSASDFLAYRDHAGHVADFHALRHTFITNLARAGVPVKVAQTLARHSTVTLTLDRYSHAEADQTAAAVATLPELQPTAAIAQATGTDDHPLRLANQSVTELVTHSVTKPVTHGHEAVGVGFSHDTKKL